jgi:hypothetical protein
MQVDRSVVLWLLCFVASLFQLGLSATSTVAARKQAVDAYLNAEVFADGKLGSLLEIEEQVNAGTVRSGASVAMLVAAKHALASKLAGHLRLKKGSLESPADDLPSADCGEKVNSWIKQCVFTDD